LLVPVAVFFYVINDIFRSWNVLTKEFKRGAVVNITTTLFSSGLTLSYGLLTGGAVPGLIIGDFLIRPIDTYFMQSKNIKKNIGKLYSGYEYKRLKEVFKQYKNYPLYILPSNWLNNLSNQLPIFMLIGTFDASVVGYFNQANSLLTIPFSILAGAVAPVFLQKAAEVYHEDPKRLSLLVKEVYDKLFY